MLLSRKQSNFWTISVNTTYRRQNVEKNLFYKVLIKMLCFGVISVLIQWDFFFGKEEVTSNELDACHWKDFKMKCELFCLANNFYFDWKSSNLFGYSNLIQFMSSEFKIK